MSMTLSGFDFDGPYSSPEALINQAGVYVVLGRNRWSNLWEVLDAGTAQLVCDELVTHRHARRWAELSRALGYCAYYGDERDYDRIVREIRRWYDPPAYED